LTEERGLGFWRSTRFLGTVRKMGVLEE